MPKQLIYYQLLVQPELCLLRQKKSLDICLDFFITYYFLISHAGGIHSPQGFALLVRPKVFLTLLVENIF